MRSHEPGRRRPSRRRTAWAAGAALVTALWSLGGAATAGAATAWAPIAVWEMDQPGSVLVDSSGNGVHGAVGDRVRTGVAVDGAVGHAFPGRATEADRGLLDLVDGDLTNPKGDEWALAMRFRTWQPTANLVQKGQARTEGGFYKLELTDGRAYCVFRGSWGAVSVGSGTRLDDGAWHSLRCERHWDWVGMWVDGVLVSRSEGTTGYIANADLLSIGGKPNCNLRTVSCDYLAGTVDRVALEHLVAVADPAPPSPVAPPAPGPVVK